MMPGTPIRALGVLAACSVCTLFARPAAAQGAGIWHATIAPTLQVRQPAFFAWDFTGGGEWRQGHAGIGVDVSWFYSPPVTERFGTSTVTVPGSSTPPMVAVLGAYHFGQPGRPHTAEPFVDGGLVVPTVAPIFIFQLGGGVDWWVTSRVGIRASVRNLVVEPPLGLLAFEAGLVFR